MNRPISYIFYVFSSPPNYYGNQSFAFNCVRTSDGKVASAKVAGGSISNILWGAKLLCGGIDGPQTYSYSNQELKIRKFNEYVKGFPAIGSSPEQILEYIQKKMNEKDE